MILITIYSKTSQETKMWHFYRNKVKQNFTLKTCPYVPLPTTSISSNIPAGSYNTCTKRVDSALSLQLLLKLNLTNQLQPA